MSGNLVLSLCVIGIYLFCLIDANFLKNGITDPLEFMTFPYLTNEKAIFWFPTILFAATNNFKIPIKTIGIPDTFIDQGKVPTLHHKYQLSVEALKTQIEAILDQLH